MPPAPDEDSAPLSRWPGSLREASSGRRLSADALAAEAAARAALWSARGVSPGARVILLQRLGTPLVADLLALWRLGACAVPLDPDLPRAELDAVSADCGAALILRRGRVRALDGAPLPSIPAVESPDAADAAPLPDASRAPDLEAVLLYTSGTTAGPKAVVHSRAGLASRLRELRRAVPAAALERALCVLPPHFGHGLIGGVLLPLAAGAETMLAAPAATGAALELGELLDDSRASFVTGVPALWRAAARASRPPRGGFLRRAHCASSPLDAALRRALADWLGAAELVDAYGMTETASWISGSDPAETRAGVVGRGWGAEFRIAAEGAAEPAPAAAGSEGEVWVRAASTMRGYHARPELTARALRAGWLRTGDRGVLESDGALRLLGRLDEAIDRGGIKVQPEETEAALRLHPEVADCCVFAAPHPLAGAEPAAAVVWRAGGERRFAALERWCAERLAAAKVPRRWFALARVPRTPSGKPRRRETAAECLGGRAADAA